MNKKATVEGINAVHQFRNAGIETAAFYRQLTGETTSSIESTFHLALTLPSTRSLSSSLTRCRVPDCLKRERHRRKSGLEQGKQVTFVYTSSSMKNGCAAGSKPWKPLLKE
jgi:hypothetical protein